MLALNEQARTRFRCYEAPNGVLRIEPADAPPPEWGDVPVVDEAAPSKAPRSGSRVTTVALIVGAAVAAAASLAAGAHLI